MLRTPYKTLHSLDILDEILCAGDRLAAPAAGSPWGRRGPGNKELLLRGFSFWGEGAGWVGPLAGGASPPPASQTCLTSEVNKPLRDPQPEEGGSAEWMPSELDER